MYTFIVSLICLVLGYVIYGKVVEHIMQPDAQRATPCYAMQDGVDYTPMPTWKVFLIQFLNIAGTGPIFGTIQGLLFGPSAYFWIVLGCIFGGAAHDYMAAMISLKRGGASLPEIVGDEMGYWARNAQRYLALFLMILVVAVFVKTPAGLLANLTDGLVGNSYMFWVVVIFLYYLIAATLPISKIIGKIYPVFGVVLIFMALCIFVGVFLHSGTPIPEITDAFENHYPGGSLPVFPCMCICIACGAVSGFHATQSPLMARCIKNERYGRHVFYGAMITEGVIALIWAAAALQFANELDVAGSTPYEKIYNAMLDDNGVINPAIFVNRICNSWLGSFGAVLAILGVVIAPITTGDTALRCARLILADTLKIKQDKVLKRILICMPVFVISIILLFVKFDVLWRYFAWFNQTFSIFTFFTIAIYLAKRNKPYYIALLPGMFMVAVCVCYLCVDKYSFNLDWNLSYVISFACAMLTGVWFMMWKKKCMAGCNIAGR